MPRRKRSVEPQIGLEAKCAVMHSALLQRTAVSHENRGKPCRCILQPLPGLPISTKSCQRPVRPEARDAPEAPVTESAEARHLCHGGQARWQLFEPAEGAPRPAKRQGHSAVVDAASRRLLVFGGLAGGRSYLNDVWAFGLEAKEWEELGTAGPRPSAREDHSAILDIKARAMLLFGGYVPGRGYSDDAWAFGLEDQQWRELRREGELPPGRELHSAIFDPKGRQMVVFGGRGGDLRALDDVFILELQAERWAKLRPEGRRPAARWGHSASYEEAAHAMLLFGGAQGDNFFSDLWSLDLEAKRWEEIQAAEGPPARQFHTSACAAGQLLVFGGNGAGGRLGDLWMFDLEAEGEREHGRTAVRR
ncbi:GPA3 [Symbiodinium natans]|uniref:GPA3 protein n=1 Tax=Symbiodinium natans TaxID=878477 RepID=A0A812KYP3_9DINO|nr:GPA3 [Symbiodinium natans]